MMRFATLLLISLLTLRVALAATYGITTGAASKKMRATHALAARHVHNATPLGWLTGVPPTAASLAAASAVFTRSNLATAQTVASSGQLGISRYQLSTTYLAKPGGAPMALGAPMGQSPALGLNVYPNPAHGQTNVLINGPGGADYKLRLNNVLGSEVRRLLVRPDNQSTTGFALDVSDLPPGLYFCSLLVNDKALVTKRLTVL